MISGDEIARCTCEHCKMWRALHRIGSMAVTAAMQGGLPGFVESAKKELPEVVRLAEIMAAEDPQSVEIGWLVAEIVAPCEHCGCQSCACGS